MKSARLTFLVCLLTAPGTSAVLSFSWTGSLLSPEDAFQQSFLLTADTSVAISTWSFGGGTNAAGSAVTPGGFDPLVALFTGSPGSESIVNIGGNPVADADTLTTFTGNCPPAGTVVIGLGSSVCGDDLMIVSHLPAGAYTLLLTDANYLPLAVDPGPPYSERLSDGFSDLTGGVFQTCNSTFAGTACITPTGSYAVDIRVLDGPGLLPVTVPETETALYVALALALISVRHRTALQYQKEKR